MTSPACTRVLLADDHALIRHGVRLVLESRPGLRVVRVGDDPASGVRAQVTRSSGLTRLQGAPPGPCWLSAEAVEPIPPDVVVEHWRAAHP